MESSLNTAENSKSTREDTVLCQLEDLLAHGSSYVDKKIEILKSSTREVLIESLVEVSGAYFGTVTVLIAVAWLMCGIAIGVGTYLDGKIWLGFILTGGAVALFHFTYSKMLIIRNRNKQRRQYAMLNEQATIAQDSFFKTSRGLKKEIADAMNVAALTRKHPFYSTGTAAAAGFIIGGGVTAQKNVGAPARQAAMEKSAIVTMLVSIVEDVVKEAIAPLVHEHITAFAAGWKEKDAGETPAIN